MSASTDVEAHDVVTGEIVSRHGALVALAAPLLDIVAHQRDYLEACKQLLDETDIQVIGKKSFKKRSAWNKLSAAFAVSTEEVRFSHERDERGRIIRTEYVVRAIAPNGRHSDGVGACDLFERCCDPATCVKLTVWADSGRPTGHVHCTSFPCKTAHFSNPQHDIPATAFTRASNRAKADLFGTGEVSAEEVTPTAEEMNSGPARLSQDVIGNIGALFQSCSMTDPEARKTFVVKVINRTPDRIADLTPSEAADLIVALQDLEEPF